MKRTKQISALAALLCSVLLLTSCGGFGGFSSSSPTAGSETAQTYAFDVQTCSNMLFLDEERLLIDDRQRKVEGGAHNTWTILEYRTGERQELATFDTAESTGVKAFAYTDNANWKANLFGTATVVCKNGEIAVQETENLDSRISYREPGSGRLFYYDEEQHVIVMEQDAVRSTLYAVEDHNTLVPFYIRTSNNGEQLSFFLTDQHLYVKQLVLVDIATQEVKQYDIGAVMPEYIWYENELFVFIYEQETDCPYMLVRHGENLAEQMEFREEIWANARFGLTTYLENGGVQNGLLPLVCYDGTKSAKLLLLDLKEMTCRTICETERYFSYPTLSPSGEMLAFVEHGSNRATIHIVPTA